MLNLASNAVITTNATCGERGPEMFCKLVEHVPGQPVRNPQCRVCDQHSRIPNCMYYNVCFMLLLTSLLWQVDGRESLMDFYATCLLVSGGRHLWNELHLIIVLSGRFGPLLYKIRHNTVK